jgi:hypothetical protein
MAAGTCLTAQRAVSGEYAVMELCSSSSVNKWDFIMTWLMILLDSFVWQIVWVRMNEKINVLICFILFNRVFADFCFVSHLWISKLWYYKKFQSLVILQVFNIYGHVTYLHEANFNGKYFWGVLTRYLTILSQVGIYLEFHSFKYCKNGTGQNHKLKTLCVCEIWGFFKKLEFMRFPELWQCVILWVVSSILVKHAASASNLKMEIAQSWDSGNHLHDYMVLQPRGMWVLCLHLIYY